MKDKTEKQEYGVYITDKFEDRHPSYESMFVYLPVVELRGMEVRNPSNEFADFEFSSYVSWPKGEFCAQFDGVLYRNRSRVQLAEAEMMAKTLRRARKVEENLPIKPANFAQYVALMAAGLGIKHAVVLENYKGTSYSDNTHRIVPIKDAQYWIDRRLEDLKEEKLGKEVNHG